MLQSEFIDRTGYMPTYDEYRAIESLYNAYNGDKDEFCAYFCAHKKTMMVQVREIACASFAREREKLVSEKYKAQAETRELKSTKSREMQIKENEWAREKIEYEGRIKDLEERLQRQIAHKESAEQQHMRTYEELRQALKDVESLKNALRLLKA